MILQKIYLSEYKINRFEKLKLHIKQNKQFLYKNICDTESEHIYYILNSELLKESCILNNINDKLESIDIYNITKKFHRLYILNVLFPIVYDIEKYSYVDKYSIDYYEENDDCKKRRAEYSNNIKKLEGSYKQIFNL